MNRKAAGVLLGLLAIGAWLLLSGGPRAGADPAATAAAPAHLRPITHPSAALLPLPPPTAVDADKAALGQRLFFDVRLSHDDSLSCASCHNLAHGGADGRTTARGIGGQVGTVNTPTVFNTDLNIAQFWDGRAARLEEQAAGPVHNPLEMGSNWQEVGAKLARDADYVQSFRRLYPQGINGASVTDAIASFERTLRTPGSRFDRYLQGDDAVLTAQERAGYRNFLDYGCASCHQGAGIGGNMFQRFGVLEDYYRDRRSVPSDMGRFNVTQRPEDRHVFKVPGLRNVALTAPYFHDASAATLEAAVMLMARYQLDVELPGQDLADLVAFLASLTGEKLPQ